MTENKFIDDLDVEYDTYEEYCNSPNLDTDIIFSKLWNGQRTPQNDKEISWLKELEEMKKRGAGIELSFD